MKRGEIYVSLSEGTRKPEKQKKQKMAETIGDMAKHGVLIGLLVGFLSFLYMGVFGHGAPTRLAGPFFKQ